MSITHDEVVTTVLRRLQPFAAITVRDMDEELRSVLSELSVLDGYAAWGQTSAQSPQ